MYPATTPWSLIADSEEEASIGAGSEPSLSRPRSGYQIAAQLFEVSSDLIVPTTSRRLLIAAGINPEPMSMNW